jgi:putative acetyltransferase
MTWTSPPWPEDRALNLDDVMTDLRIELDDLTRPQVQALLHEHLANMYELSPPDSVHALDLDKLRQPGISFWTVWRGEVLMGCGALKQLSATHAEIKSMRTPAARRRTGAGRAVLAYILAEARRRGYERLSLETGVEDAFAPAHRLYESFGFRRCGPFEGYVEDPHSVFMDLRLNASPA